MRKMAMLLTMQKTDMNKRKSKVRVIETCAVLSRQSNGRYSTWSNNVHDYAFDFWCIKEETYSKKSKFLNTSKRDLIIIKRGYIRASATTDKWFQRNARCTSSCTVWAITTRIRTLSVINFKQVLIESKTPLLTFCLINVQAVRAWWGA